MQHASPRWQEDACTVGSNLADSTRTPCRQKKVDVGVPAPRPDRFFADVDFFRICYYLAKHTAGLFLWSS
jgi:hypothetical protein